jgi:hypothetical protein
MISVSKPLGTLEAASSFFAVAGLNPSVGTCGSKYCRLDGKKRHRRPRVPKTTAFVIACVSSE